ncbi:acm2 protein [Lactiplantibacillus xiangfangensis]|uniref:Acm2 protein n=3 Tax=Lactiplantibacillus xiangfangensis TaxID=942150 RepID=A0A0R2M0E0_9LACO|nr:SH3 domain-containing protein [Lactiplantibacillus xiangfangensis]KRO07662.1 acm2 protein [Lactiplantibacillus xiangfangensis]
MGMTKIVASLMLSTALLPAMLSKADTTTKPANNQETVEPVTETTYESTATGTANQTRLVTTTLSQQTTGSQASSQATSGTQSGVAQSAEGTSQTSASSATSATSAETPASQVSSSSVSKSAAAAGSDTQIKASAPTSLANNAESLAASAAEASTAASVASVKASAATSATASTATSVAASATSVANANSAVATESSVASVASHAVVPEAETLVTAPVAATPAPQPEVYVAEADRVTARVSPQQYFLDEIKAGAIAGWHKYQVLPSVTAAQAILESGWGASELAKKGNNLFGIKGSYNGQSIVFNTQEWDGHRYITVKAAFRKYPNWSASVEDHGAFLVENPRYKNLLGVTDYRRVAALLQQDGYATDPHYASSLINVIRSYYLQDWDSEALGGQPGQDNGNQGQVTPESGRYTFTQATPIHNTTDKNSAVVGTYEAGESVYYNAKVNANGQTWLQYLSYSGMNHYVMIKDATPAPAPGPVAPTTPSNTLPSTGSYTFTVNTNIRNGASKGAAIAGHYDAGQKVNYNGTVQADGLTWLRYVSYSGATHYVATSGDDVVAAPKPEVQNVSGFYQFTQNTAIKSAADNNSNTVGTYGAGERVYYNAKVTVGGQTWLRYVSYSGATHYVQVTPANVGPNLSQAVVTPATGAYHFTHTTAIKNAADRNSATVGTYYAGNTVYYNAKVTVNGQTWLRYQSYSGASHYVEVGAVTSQADRVTPQKGSFRFTTTTNIRTAPTTRAGVVGEYYAGDVVYYDGTVKAEGYTWLRYLSRSGAIHYVAIVR